MEKTEHAGWPGGRRASWAAQPCVRSTIRLDPHYFRPQRPMRCSPGFMPAAVVASPAASIIAARSWAATWLRGAQSGAEQGCREGPQP
jgi:hypothetical protein